MSYKSDEKKKLKRLFRNGEITKEEYEEELGYLNDDEDQAPSYRIEQKNNFDSMMKERD